jgi:hypothetical protein
MRGDESARVWTERDSDWCAVLLSWRVKGRGDMRWFEMEALLWPAATVGRRGGLRLQQGPG